MIVFCVVDGRAVREMLPSPEPVVVCSRECFRSERRSAQAKAASTLPLLVRFETAKLHAARNFSFSFHTVPFFNIDHITRTR